MIRTVIPALNDILSSQATTLGLAALIVLALMTGVITPGKAAQKRVDDANSRAEDFKLLYNGKDVEAQALRAQLVQIATESAHVTQSLDLVEARRKHAEQVGKE